MTDVTSSRLASASTITGVLPPSSSDGLAMLALQYSSTVRPAPTLPVRVIMPTAGCWQRVAATSCCMVRIFKTPAGKPASWAAAAISNAEVGVLLLGRTTTLLPAINAGAILRNRVDRVVERNQASHDPDGFALQQDGFIGRIAGDHFAFDAAGPFGVVARDGGSIDRLVGGVLQTFTRLARQGLTYDGRTLFQGIGEGTQV